MPVPEIVLNFSENILNAYVDGDNQRTQSIKVNGNSSYALSIQLQNNVVLVNETRGTESTGIVNVYGGDTFYLKAPLSVNGSWTSNSINNHKYKYQPIIYRSSRQDYQVLAGRYQVVVDPTSTINLNVNWIDAGKVRIHKTDEQTGQAISDTVFKIKNSNGDVVDTIKTDSNGFATSSNLSVGTYQVVEVTSNDKYILNNAPIEIKINAGETKTIDVTNKHKEGSLKIVKVDSRDNKTPIPNVTFEIWSVELDKKIATETTGEDGTILVENLRIGEYKIKEVSTNQWYVLDTKENTAIVKWDKTTTLVVGNNVKTGYIEIIKQDADYSDIKLANVKFEIRNSKNELVDTLVTNENGYAKSKALPIDETYTIKEIETSSQYVLSSDIQIVNFTPADEGKTKQLILNNEHKKGNLKVYKVDADNNQISLGAVEFDLYSEEFNKVIGTYSTDNNGEIFIEDLRIGNYTLIETSTNQWYDLADDTQIVVEYDKTKEVMIQNELKKGRIKVVKVDSDNNEIKIPNVIFEVLDRNNRVLETIKTDENGEALTNKYAIRDYKTLKLHEIETNQWYVLNDDVVEVKLEENQIKEIQFKNEKKKGQIKVIKVDLDNTEIRIPNVEFEVLDESGKVVDKILTDKNGEAVSKKLPIDQKYTIREIKTNEKYVLTEEAKIITLQYNQITNVQFENEKKKGQIEVYKIDSENNEIKLGGVEFEVINSKGEVVEKIITDSNGYAITSRLPIGEYLLKEVKTDSMHILSKEIVKVKVETDIISRLEITNDRIKGQIKIIKTSQDDNFITGEKAGDPIKNVEFEIYNINNELVDKIVTNEDGIAITKKLDKGKYIIRETKSGEWYLLNEHEFNAEININEEIVEVQISNESDKPEVDIEKTGIIQTTKNEEVRYDFKIRNTGNVELNHFTWYDYLPSDYVSMTKLVTGTYNQELYYNIYYKTNLNDYRVLAENLYSQTNNYIDFTNIPLHEGEVITEFKIDFGTVDVGFESVSNPYIFVKVNSIVENEDTFTNKTRLEGQHSNYLVWDEDNHTTKIYEKEVTIKKLPRTGC